MLVKIHPVTESLAIALEWYHYPHINTRFHFNVLIKFVPDIVICDFTKIALNGRKVNILIVL